MKKHLSNLKMNIQLKITSGILSDYIKQNIQKKQGKLDCKRVIKCFNTFNSVQRVVKL